MRFAREAPVRGRLAAAGAMLVGTLGGRGDRMGRHVGAFDATSGVSLWASPQLPPLAFATDGELYAYGRAGTLACLELDGTERWRIALPDDRSRPARERGDDEAPFAADVVPMGDAIAVAAGDEVILLDASSGAVLARSRVARGERAVVDRLAGDGDGLLCTCGERTDWDDELRTQEPMLWQRGPSLEERRTAPGQLLALTPDLAERWRSSVPFDDVVLTGRRPALLDGVVVLAGAGARSDETGRRRSTFHHRLLAFGRDGGELRWTRPLPGGRGRWDPLMAAGGVLVGGEPALYAAADGAERWRLDAGALKLDVDVRPAEGGGRLLFAGDGRALDVDAGTGTPREGPAFAARPFGGAITTTLVIAAGALCVGVTEAAGPIELRAVEVDA